MNDATTPDPLPEESRTDGEDAVEPTSGDGQTGGEDAGESTSGYREVGPWPTGFDLAAAVRRLTDPMSDNASTFPEISATYVSKGDMVLATLREMIVTGAIQPGSQLRQRDLAEQFGVSPTPVREALRRLEAQGLVETNTHKGATVVEGDFGATEHNYRIRAALESEVAAMAAEVATEEDFVEIEELAARFAATTKSGPQRSQLNGQFHFRIYTAARSPLAMSLLRLLWQAFPEGPQTLRPHAQSVREHAALAEALRARDGVAAARICHDHIISALPYLRKNPGSSSR